MNRASRREVVVVGLLLCLAALFAWLELWRWRWVADDAFISFRYAENFSEGLGLVFNAGEKVEGYTNFLWTLLVAAGQRLGMEPVTLTTVLGVVAYLGTVLTWAVVSWKLYRLQPSRPFLPVASLCLLVQHDQHVFATCGLETAWVTWFVTLAFALLLFAQRPREFYLAGAALAVAALSRPDALIFLVSAGAFTLAWPGARLAHTVRLFAVPLLLYLPYWVWRYVYYSFPFPNTYYAKSADLAYYTQGLAYIGLYVRSYFVLTLVPIALAWLCVRFKPRAGPEARAGWLIAVFVLPYTLYVMRVGGDFMFGRFLLPVAGLCFFALECALISTPLRRAAARMAAVILVGAVWARHDPYSEALIVSGVADEPACYPAQWHQRARESGRTLETLFAGKDVRVAFTGRYAMWVYYSSPAYAIEAETGLTDTAIAHRRISARGRPGHEKPATLEELHSRGVHFLLRPPVPRTQLFDSLRVVQLGDLEVLALHYDSELMDSFGGDSSVSFVNFPRWLDDVFVSPPHNEVQVRELSNFSRSYYFNFNDDPERLQKLEQWATGVTP